MLSTPLTPTTPPGYRIVHTRDTGDWRILDPMGGTICRATTQACAEELARALAGLSAARDPHRGC
jgi:hypothetical protein